MSFLPAYLDSSAIMKLILPEPESEALEEALQAWPDRLSSELASVEIRRSLRRIGASSAVERRAEGVLKTIILLRLDEPVLRLAARVGMPLLRSLDAIHLASALSLGDDPDAFITYDDRLATAARKLKIRLVQPGRVLDRRLAAEARRQSILASRQGADKATLAFIQQVADEQGWR